MGDHRLQVILGHIKAAKSAPFDLHFSPAAYPATTTQRKLKYTLDSGIKLSQSQREFYEENGYIVIKNLVSAEDIGRYSLRFKKICEELEQGKKPPGMTVMKDVANVKLEFVKGERAVNKIQDFQYDDVMFEYCCLPKILDYVECFVGPDVMAMHTMLINKPPDPGSNTSRHPMHQDLHYFPFRPADRIVCSWTAMEKVHPQNGCLVVVPGTHKGNTLHPHVYPKWEGGVNKMYHGIPNTDLNDPQALRLEMETGDTVFFHPLLIHGSGANKTTGFRKAISCHYASSSCHYIPTEGTTQQNIANETIEVGKKRLGDMTADVKFEDLWKMKGRLVKGKEINL